MLYRSLAIAACAFVFRDRPWEAERVYREYDREFRAYLAHANERIGKEVIKVERLSDQFTVPQKLTIHGTPHEIGLEIGHVAKQAGSRPPMVAAANLELNRKMAEVYQRIYPEQLEVVRGVADVFDKPAETDRPRRIRARTLQRRCGPICSSSNGLR